MATYTEPLIEHTVRQYRETRAWMRAAIHREIYAMAYRYPAREGGLQFEIRYKKSKRVSGEYEWDPPFEFGPFRGIISGPLGVRKDQTRIEYEDRPIKHVCSRFKIFAGRETGKRMSLGATWPDDVEVITPIAYASACKGFGHLSQEQISERISDWKRRHGRVINLYKSYVALRRTTIEYLQQLGQTERCLQGYFETLAQSTDENQLPQIVDFATFGDVSFCAGKAKALQNGETADETMGEEEPYDPFLV
jgi:hypothetical protein